MNKFKIFKYFGKYAVLFTSFYFLTQASLFMLNQKSDLVNIAGFLTFAGSLLMFLLLVVDDVNKIK
jgi:uncharacterized protein with PQ loop repeat